MPLPVICCPACNARYSLDVVFAHEGVRETMMQLVNAHPEGARLLGPLVRYISLFAPAKNELSLDRIARLLAEVVPMIREAKITREGRVWSAPLATWIVALEDILTRRDKLTLPIKSHGYLQEIVIGIVGKTEAKAEQRQEDQRRGVSGLGAAKAAPVERSAPPTAFRDLLKTLPGAKPKGSHHD